MGREEVPLAFDAFLSDNPDYQIRMGAPCSVCASGFVEVLNRSIKRYAQRKALPATHKDSTTMTRGEFVKSYVWNQFPDLAKKDPRTIYRHAEACIGIPL